ncbi:MAG: hypothetical protein ACI4J7_14025 [Ruminiclostridium sp.]
MKLSHEMAQSVLKRKKKILKRRNALFTAFGAAGGIGAVVLIFALASVLPGLHENIPTVTEKASETSVIGTTPAEETNEPIAPLDSYIGEDGNYYLNTGSWEKIEDFDLFREYFFGSWENTEGVGIVGGDTLVLDDSEKSFIASVPDYRLSDGHFYRTDENTLAFFMNGNAEMYLFRLDTRTPDTMYMEPCYYMSENEVMLFTAASDSYIPARYSKTDSSVNLPEKNYLSIFRLYEIAREYGIEPDMLINLGYDMLTEKGCVKLLHDDWYQFYPVYLVSEEAEKLVLSTRVGNLMYPDFEKKVTVSIEKIGGKWTRKVEAVEEFFGINSDIISELGKTFSQLSKKYGSTPTGIYNSYTIENGHGRYGWKTADGKIYDDNMELAGGCNMIDGLKPGELFIGVSYPVSYEDLTEKYGFTLIEAGSETGMDDLYSSEFNYPLYEDISFIFYAKEYGMIEEDTSCCIVLNTKYKDVSYYDPSDGQEHSGSYTGELIPEEFLEKWDIEKITETLFTGEYGNAELISFLDGLSDSGLKEAYEKAYVLRTAGYRDFEDYINRSTLEAYYGTYYENPNSLRAVLYDENTVQKGKSSGYLYESVADAYYDTFEKEYADELLKNMHFYRYGKELFYTEISGGRHCYPEYEILSENNSKTVILETCYKTNEIGEKTEEILYINVNVFVKTEAGWKCSCFGMNTEASAFSAEDGLLFTQTAENAAKAYLSGDKEKLSEYLLNPDYETGLTETSENLLEKLEYGVLKPPEEVYTGLEVGKTYLAVYEYALTDSDMVFYLDIGLKKTDSGWEVEYIYLQG